MDWRGLTFPEPRAYHVSRLGVRRWKALDRTSGNPDRQVRTNTSSSQVRSLTTLRANRSFQPFRVEQIRACPGPRSSTTPNPVRLLNNARDVRGQIS